MTLVVSSGREQVPVPDVIGRGVAEAANLLGQKGFQTTTRNQASDTVAEGMVIGTDPPAGQQADRGSLVTILVSAGPATTTVPDVVGDSEAQATTKLKAAGFAVQTQTEVVTKNKDVGKVLDQSPTANRDAPTGSTVTITVGVGVAP